MHFWRQICATSALVVAVSGPLSAQTVNQVLATVGDTEIKLSDVVAAYDSLAPEQKQIPGASLLPALLDRLISQAALAQTAGPMSERDAAALRVQQRAMTASIALQATVGPQLSEERVRAIYEEEYANAEPQEEFNASHILLETEEEAEAAIARIEAGENFGDLARELSTGPSGPNGGQLGWFGLGAMVPPFEAAVTQLDVGGVSAPVETQFGWHVVTLNDKRVPAIPPFEEVAGEFVRQLEQALVGDAIDAARAAVDIEILDRSELDPETLKAPGIFEN